MNFDIIRDKLKSLLEKAVQNNLAKGILLSGGLDTSILATIASKYNGLKAFTVALKKAPALDIKFAKLMAENLQINHVIHFFDKSELLDAISKTIEIMRSFDPMEIRNSAAIYIGMKIAKENGIKAIMTGDGADELFGGYSFFFGKSEEELTIELKKISNIMSFSSILLGKSLGIEAKLPYLDPEFKKFSLDIPSRYKVFKEKGKIIGKWILRKSFEKDLPKEIIWRDKAPIEQGSGTYILPNLFNQEISDTEFNEKKRKYFKEDNVSIRDKEQLFYYELYRKSLGIPHPTDPKQKICPHCNSNVRNEANFCKTCGAYPI
ncbi:MAG: asparagine synthase [Candidatus Helarchaeota archaeon]|nr:asparagine synthase [Candidatus Helarchaeota archaeon]